MYQLKIQNAIKTCESHISQFDKDDFKLKEVEIHLVSSLVILIVSEFEEYLETLFIKRAEKSGDSQTTRFIKNTLNQKFRSPDINKINETLKRFDPKYQESFLSNVENTPMHSAWDSLMKARHAIVHKKGTLNLTFEELLNNYPLTIALIQHLEASLNPPPP